MRLFFNEQQPASQKTLWALTIAAALFFLFFRLFVICSATDHIRHVFSEEYQIADYARHILADQPFDLPFKHLWGLKITAYALCPFLAMGFSEAQALKFLAVILGLIGFVPLFFVITKRAGLLAALIFTLLYTFPHPIYLKWALTIWGGYTEANSLLPALIAFWIIILEKQKIWWYFAFGLVSAVLFAYSPSIFYVLALIAIITAVQRIKNGRLLDLLGGAGGFLLGMIPLALFLSSGVAAGNFDAHSIPGSTDQPLWTAFSLPTGERIQQIFRIFTPWMDDVFSFEWYVFLLSMIWIAACFIYLKGAVKAAVWPILLPMTLFVGPVVIASFTYITELDIRHLLWVFTASYLGIAIFLSAPIAGRFTQKLGRVFPVFEFGIKAIILGILIVWHISASLPMLQPGELSILSRYRGMDYYRNGLWIVVGDEVGNVNCLLDHPPKMYINADFKKGLADTFSSVTQGPPQNEFILAPYKPHWHNIKAFFVENNIEKSLDYFTGQGCGIAIKPACSTNDLQKIEKYFGPEVYEAAQKGYDTCKQLPCLNKN